MTSGREEVATLLYSLQDSIASLARRIDDGLRHLPDVKSDDLERFLSEYRHLFVVWHKEQLEDWDAFVASNVLQSLEPWDPSLESPSINGSDRDNGRFRPYGSRLHSLEKRLVAMGGIPALGSAALPSVSAGAPGGLRTTASPAAIELHRARLGGSEADMNLRSIPESSKSEEPVMVATTISSTTPRVHLKIVKLEGSHGVGGDKAVGETTQAMGSVGLAAPGPESELAAALKRRRAATEAPVRSPVGTEGTPETVQ